ncbi:hypothetical protein [Actinoallomurus acaciae]|uniref:Uncharacterized protein n=1 Tax=Actinoallomurus acaciae TaxID=502577 RepID=A0ABV5YXF2_9ACTN
MGLIAAWVTWRRTGDGACPPTRSERAVRPYAGRAAGRMSPLYALDGTGRGDRVEVRPVDAIEEI